MNAGQTFVIRAVQMADNFRQIIPIGVFYGGRTHQTDQGLTYDPPDPRFNIYGYHGCSLDFVRQNIYEKMRLNLNEQDIVITNRQQVSKTNAYWFEAMPINDESDWQMAMALVASTQYNYNRIQLFVKVVRRRSTPRQINLNEPDYTGGGEFTRCSGQFRDFSGAGPSNLEVYGTALQVESEDEDANYAMKDADYGDEEDDVVYDKDHTDRIEHLIPSWANIEGMERTEDDWFEEGREINNTPISVGNMFTSKQACANTVKKWHVESKRECRVYRSDTRQLVFLCSKHPTINDVGPSCYWSLRANRVSSGDSMWCIMAVSDEPHKCTGIVEDLNHNLTASVIADYIFPYIQGDPDKTIQGVKDLVHANFQEHIGTAKAWRGREEALGRLFGTWENAYALLPSIMKAIVRTNPETKWRCSYEHDDALPTPNHTYFSSIGWAFGPCIKAARYIRPVVSIDACHLSGKYGGKLVTMVGYDGQNHIVPIAFGIIHSESTESWGWWMRWIREALVVPADRKFCVISDRHAAIKAVFKSPLYGWNEDTGVCVHRYCVQHVAENLYKLWPSKLIVGMFKWTAKRYTLHLQYLSNLV